MAYGNKAKSKTDSEIIDATLRQGTTPERLRRADGHVHVENGVQYLRDDTLDRALNRKRITSRQYDAGKKYRHHWYHAGLAGNLRTSWDGVFGSENMFGGMPRSEAEAFHRKQYRIGRAELEKRQCVDCIEQFVCYEIPLKTVGLNGTRWKTRLQAEAAILERIQIGLDILADCYGM